MCRRNQLLGFALMAFGIGLLMGCFIESSFLGGCLGIGAMSVGIAVIQKK